MKTAITKLLNVDATAPAWSLSARKVLDDMPEAERFSFLLPYLDSKSVLGAHAAIFLSKRSEYRDKAIEYLKGMKESDDPELEKAAKQALQEVEESGE